MRKRLIGTLVFSMFAIGLANAQKIKIKKGIVYIDGTECLKVSGDSNTVAFSTLEDEEIIFVKYVHGSGHNLLYNKVVFLKEEMELSSSTLTFTKKYLLKKLIKSGVLKDCMLDSDKVEKFVIRYDEKVERRY